MSTVKSILCLLVVMAACGLAGRLDYEDAVMLEQIERQSIVVVPDDCLEAEGVEAQALLRPQGLRDTSRPSSSSTTACSKPCMQGSCSPCRSNWDRDAVGRAATPRAAAFSGATAQPLHWGKAPHRHPVHARHASDPGTSGEPCRAGQNYMEIMMNPNTSKSPDPTVGPANRRAIVAPAQGGRYA